jgi:hypothetical protein
LDEGRIDHRLDMFALAEVWETMTHDQHEEMAAGMTSGADVAATADKQAEGASPGLAPEVQGRLLELVARSQNVMAHGWMIRTFIKHCDEVEDFPELNEMARTIFDVFRAVETQIEDPLNYFRTVRKKLAKLRSAAEQFQKDAWHASTHTNFQQCAIAARFLGQQLDEILQQAEMLLPRPTPPKIVLPGRAATGSSGDSSHPVV